MVRSEVENGLADAKAAAEHEQQWELEGGQVDLIETNVDHWTDGSLSQLNGELAEFKSSLSDQNSEELTLDQLKMMATTAAERRVQVGKALEVAQEQCALSQQRWEFMDAVAESLSDYYNPVKDGYFEGDQRNGYSLLMVLEMKKKQVVLI